MADFPCVFGSEQASIRCLEMCKENNIVDFDFAFAYEALARAYAVAGEKAECEKYIHLAKEAGEQIKSKEDKDYFYSELETISVYSKR